MINQKIVINQNKFDSCRIEISNYFHILNYNKMRIFGF